MEAWRQVELAACEELPGLLGAGKGPSAADLQAIREATFTVEAVNERERMTDHDVAAFVDVLAASAGEAGRWIHYGLTASDVLDTALALQLRAAGELDRRGRRRARATPSRRARASTCRRCAWGAPTASMPSRRRSASSSRASRSRRTATRGAWSAPSRRRRWGAISGAVGHLRGHRARVRGAGARAAGAGARAGLHPGRGARPPCGAPAAIALAGAGLERLATEVRHLQRTEVREVQEPFRAGQKGSSAMPHKRNPIRASRSPGWRGCCAATRRRPWRTSRCGTSATSRTPPSSG